MFIFDLVPAGVEVLGYCFDRYIRRVPVSYPGDELPIENQQSRVGQWKKREIPFLLEKGWMVSVDAESHTISIESIKRQVKGYVKNHNFLGVELTGESAGRQIWYRKDFHEVDASTEKVGLEHGFDASVNPNSADKIHRQIMLDKWVKSGKKLSHADKKSIKTAGDAARLGLSFYQQLQCDDGHWAGDYGGPMFLMPGLICCIYATKGETRGALSPSRKKAMVHYLKNHQQVDGGWGTHIECASTMFGTVLSYVALRLLGEGADEPYMKAAREFIHLYKGALYAPSWAKFWMAVIGVYDWKGINSIPVEMWMLPRWLPFHPGRLWCHCRMVYLPMGYAYCKRFTPDVENDPVLLSLRKELYCQDYDTINWDAYRQTCAPIDEYSPLNPVMKVAQDFLSYYEYFLPMIWPLKWLREKALEFVIDYIHEEDKQTNYVDIGPVNKALNMLAVWVDGGHDCDNEKFLRHIPRIDDYLWVAEDGMKMQGYNGSQCWDTSFAIQAIVEGDLAKEFPDCARKIYSYLDRTQIATDEDNREYYFRHQSKGGWPFSTAAHGWPITDCTSEGLKAVLCLHTMGDLIPLNQRISPERLKDSCDVILSYQNWDGGWATYENNRGDRWYEMLNPSEVFGDIMIDYSYVECSSACITALIKFVEEVPDYRTSEIKKAIESGRTFLKSIQRKDGSWYGSWGNCFTYGTWFGIEGLIAAGEGIDSPSIMNAVEFLLSKQNPNGGWGESYLACVNKAYPENGTGYLGEGESGVVQTAWALLGLMQACCTNEAAIKRGIEFLMKKQLESGDWNQEGITGVFNRSCAITYTAYRNVFPLWALSRYYVLYEKR